MSDKLCILACDATAGWNLNQYDAQKGHTICLRTNVADCEIQKIVWTFSDNAAAPSTEHRACVVFTKDDGNGMRSPGEGFVTIFVAVATKSGQCRCAHREILIVPEVKCQLVFQDDYLIKCDTRCIDVQLQGLCQALSIGNPFPSSGVDGFACGGACENECPHYETLMSAPKGTRIFHYGRHCACADVSIRQEVFQLQNCAPLYSDNFLGKNARYPPAVQCFCIVPRNLEMRVEASSNKRWHKRFVICNLSEYMLPECATVKWRISDKSGRVFWKESNRSATLCYEFRCINYYCIEAVIRVSDSCEPSKVKVFLKLVDRCNADCDIVLQPEPVMADLLPESLLEIAA